MPSSSHHTRDPRRSGASIVEGKDDDEDEGEEMTGEEISRLYPQGFGFGRHETPDAVDRSASLPPQVLKGGSSEDEMSQIRLQMSEMYSHMQRQERTISELRAQAEAQAEIPENTFSKFVSREHTDQVIHSLMEDRCVFYAKTSRGWELEPHYTHRLRMAYWSVVAQAMSDFAHILVGMQEGDFRTLMYTLAELNKPAEAIQQLNALQRFQDFTKKSLPWDKFQAKFLEHIKDVNLYDKKLSEREMKVQLLRCVYGASRNKSALETQYEDEITRLHEKRRYPFYELLDALRLFANKIKDTSASKGNGKGRDSEAHVVQEKRKKKERKGKNSKGDNKEKNEGTKSKNYCTTFLDTGSCENDSCPYRHVMPQSQEWPSTSKGEKEGVALSTQKVNAAVDKGMKIEQCYNYFMGKECPFHQQASGCRFEHSGPTQADLKQSPKPSSSLSVDGEANHATGITPAIPCYKHYIGLCALSSATCPYSHTCRTQADEITTGHALVTTTVESLAEVAPGINMTLNVPMGSNLSAANLIATVSPTEEPIPPSHAPGMALCSRYYLKLPCPPPAGLC